MKYEIEDGIEIPKQRQGKSTERGTKYGFHLMEPGQSVFIPDGDPGAGRLHDSCTPPAGISAHAYGRRQGKKFACRVVEGGYRIWRVK